MNEKKWLIAILVAAVATRLAAGLYMGDRVEPLPGIYDQISYDTLAISLLDGRGYSFPTDWWPATHPFTQTSFWSFLYPLYLAGIYGLAGHHPLVARIVQGLITGPLTAWLLYRLGRRLASPKVGLTAAAISALYIYFIYYQAALMTEPFYIATILGALVVALEIVERSTWAKWLSLGLLLGLAILLRQALLLFVPFLLAWLLWTGRKQFRPWALLLPVGIILMMLLPWTIRNYLAFGRFVLLNTNAGFAFFWANHPIHGTYSTLLEGNAYQDLIPPELRSLNEAELDAALLRLGLGFVRDDPGRYALLCLNRTFEHFKFWPSPESGLISNISRVGSFGLFLPFMLYGLVLSFRHWRRYLLLYLFAVVYCGIHLLTWAGIRYRLPVDAVLLPFAGLALVDLARRVGSHWRSAARRSGVPLFQRSDDPLLPLLRSAWDPVAAPPAGLDGAALAQRALSEGVAPLLYGRLRGTGLLPPEAEEPLRRAYYANAGRNARILHELEAALRQLEAAHVPVLLLKGAALAQTVYENPALRPLGDLDLLVHPADTDPALRALAGLGYHPVQHEPAPGSTRTYENEIMVGREGALAPIEVHWGLFDSPHHQQHLDMDWFWKTAVPLMEIAAPSVPPPARSGLPETPGSHPSPAPKNAGILSPAAQLLHLCAHIVLHHGSGGPHLLWLHDVAEVVVHYRDEIDWPAVLAQGRAGDLLAPLQRVLPRVAADWRAPIPPAILEELARLTPSRAEQRIIARLAAGYRPAGRRLLDDLADTPSWRRRLAMAWTYIFPTPAYMRRRYGIRHPLLLPFYYPYRWFLGLRGLLSPRGWR